MRSFTRENGNLRLCRGARDIGSSRPGKLLSISDSNTEFATTGGSSISIPSYAYLPFTAGDGYNEVYNITVRLRSSTRCTTRPRYYLTSF